jgi:hypothetical protein
VSRVDLEELIVAARRERPAPGALARVARGLRVPFVAAPVAALAVPTTALAATLVKATGLSRLALLGWGGGSVAVASTVVAAVTFTVPQAPAPAPLTPSTAVRPLPRVQPPAERALEPPSVEVPPVELNHEPKKSPPPVASTWDEPQLIERARKALGSEPRRALFLALEHQRRFPSGALATERDLIALEALARSGQTAEAARRGKAFIARYPNSIHLPRVRALLARIDAG